MNLYLLKRVADFGYEQYFGFVVRAESEDQARAIIVSYDGEGDLFPAVSSKYTPANASNKEAAFWSESRMIEVHGLALDVTGEPGIILASYLSA